MMLCIEKALGVRVRQPNGSIWVLVRVVKGKGIYAYWHRHARFEVVVSNNLVRRGRSPSPVGFFPKLFPRVISRPMYRYMCIHGNAQVLAMEGIK